MTTEKQPEALPDAEPFGYWDRTTHTFVSAEKRKEKFMPDEKSLREIRLTSLYTHAQPAIAPAPTVNALPARAGIYAWVLGTTTAMVLVNKRPSSHAPGGQLNGHVIDSTTFYDGCAVADWARDGQWTLLHDFDAAVIQAPQPAVAPEPVRLTDAEIQETWGRAAG